MPELPPGLSRTDWGDLRILFAVIELGSFRQAAKRVNLSPATVSRRIEALERHLGTEFFRRLPNGLELTEAGETVRDYLVTMARSATGLEDTLAHLDREVTGEVTISCGEALAVPFLSPQIKELQRAYPKLIINLLTELPVLEPSSGAADIAVQYVKAKNMNSVGVPLGTLHYCFFGTREYFDLYGEITSLTDMLNHRVIIHTQFANYDDSWPKELPPLRELVKFCMKTDSGTCMLQTTASGAALSIMPSFMSIYDDRLVMADLPPVASIRYWLVFRESQREVARIKTTVDWMRRVFDRKANPWFRDEFVHPREFIGNVSDPIMPAVMQRADLAARQALPLQQPSDQP